ncbi:MAG: polysaccharide pyruvyl transferase family protein [Bacteroidaceae bacterium]
MKIGIKTMPFFINYGGILQAYALKTYLEHQGFVVSLIESDLKAIWYKKIKRYIWNMLGLNKVYFKQFIKNNFKFIQTKKSISKLDAIVAGSDQIWRRDFFYEFKGEFFLDFAYKRKIKKIAYAASFGLDSWDYTQEETDKYKNYLADFTGVSVREDSAVSLCHQYLNVEAIKTVDPTLLLTSLEYDKIKSIKTNREKFVFIYWLGDVVKLDALITKANITIPIKFVRLKKIEELIPIEDWIWNIANAEYVITDSFHGCVFSILYKKQFGAFLNQSGGTSRIKSLLTMLHLSDYCMQNNIDEQQLKKRIDYTAVFKLLAAEKNKSTSFLCKSLSL